MKGKKVVSSSIRELKKIMCEFCDSKGLDYFKVFDLLLDSYLNLFNFEIKIDEKFKRAKEIGLTQEEFKKVALEFLKELGNRMEELNDDVLGTFYQEVISFGRFGQYFTPKHVCDVMAQMQNPKENQKVFDGACGSGAMLLAVGRITKNTYLIGQDIDSICVKMASLNLLLNNLEGEISQGDTLRNEINKTYYIKRENLTKSPFLLVREK